MVLFSKIHCNQFRIYFFDRMLQLAILKLSGSRREAAHNASTVCPETMVGNSSNRAIAFAARNSK